MRAAYARLAMLVMYLRPRGRTKSRTCAACCALGASLAPTGPSLLAHPPSPCPLSPAFPPCPLPNTGTGDAQINLGQRLPLSGALIVSTPQDVALLDARRGAQMFRKVAGMQCTCTAAWVGVAGGGWRRGRWLRVVKVVWGWGKQAVQVRSAYSAPTRVPEYWHYKLLAGRCPFPAVYTAQPPSNSPVQVHVPILGLIENMSYFTCTNCGHQEHIFGEGGVARMAADMGLDVLGQVGGVGAQWGGGGECAMVGHCKRARGRGACALAGLELICPTGLGA